MVIYKGDKLLILPIGAKQIPYLGKGFRVVTAKEIGRPIHPEEARNPYYNFEIEEAQYAINTADPEICGEAYREWYESFGIKIISMV
jgi:hypothetical protein